MILVYDFKGMFPNVADDKIADGGSVNAKDADLNSGALRAAPFSPITAKLEPGSAGAWPQSPSATSIFKWRGSRGGDLHYGGTVLSHEYSGGIYTLVVETDLPHEAEFGDYIYVNSAADYVTEPGGYTQSNISAVTGTTITTADISDSGYGVSAGERVEIIINKSLWLARTAEAEFAKAYVQEDGNEVVYVTEAAGGYPKRVFGGTSGSPVFLASVGVPASSVAPVVSVGTAGTGDLKKATYVQTRVNSLGQESAPSPASAEVSIGNSHSVTITCNIPGTTTLYPDHTAAYVYRSVTSGAGTVYQFVGSVTSGTTLIDTKNDAQLGEALSTAGFAEPRTNLRGIISVGNGIMAGYSGNMLCFCEPYQTHAWPIKYEKSIDFDIVGLSALGSSVVLFTKEDLFIARGTHPSNYTVKKVGINQGCVSSRSIARVGDHGVLFASPDGLVLVSDEGISTLTQGIYSAKDWRKLNPASMSGLVYDNMYVASYRDEDGTRKSIIIDPANLGRGAIISSRSWVGTFSDPSSDESYYVAGNYIRSFQGSKLGIKDPYTWKSKIYRLPYAHNLTAAEVVCDEYSDVTFKLYAEDESGVMALKHTQVVTSKRPFRMPSGYKSTAYQIEITGKSTVNKALVSSSVEELVAA